MNLFARFFCMLFLILCSGFVLVGQTFITNTTPIDEKRYSEYGGTPYLFKVHKTVDLYLTGDSKPYSVMLNINMQEKEVEVFKGVEYAAISYNEVDSIDAGESGKIVPDNGHLTVEHYKDDQYHLIETPTLSIRETTTNLPGEIVEKKTFTIKNNYKLTINGQTHAIKMKKKSIIGVLGKEAEKTAKKSKNRLKSINDLVSLLEAMYSTR